MKITTDGNHKIEGKQGMGGGTSIVYVSGDLGGATAVLSYYDGDNMVALTDGSVAVGEQYQVDHGHDIFIYLVVSGATGSTDINIAITGKA